MSSKDLGADEVASSASRQDAGEFVSACVMLADGMIDSPARDWVTDSREFMVVDVVYREMVVKGLVSKARFWYDSIRFGPYVIRVRSKSPRTAFILQESS